ncbi:MAG: Fic family protein [bacterium]|nr:Fic family protein [bacterium]
MSERNIFKDLTIYDVFLGVVGHKSLTLERLKEVMWLTEDSNVEKCLQTLLDMKLLVKQKDGEYASSNSPASQKLFDALSFALAGNLDYNFYLSENMRTLLSNVYGRPAFTVAHCKGLSQQTVYRMIRYICLDDLAIVFDYSPMSAKLTSSHFYDLLCEYWKITPKKAGFFDRKVKIDMIIMERMLAHSNKDRSKIVAGSKLFFTRSDDKSVLDKITSKLQNLLKYDIVPKNPDIFDAQQTQRTKQAIEYQDQMISTGRQLTIDMLKTYHAISMFGNREPVPYRNFEVKIANNSKFKPCPAADIETTMAKFMDNYKNAAAKTNSVPKALELAANVYNGIIHIQPFEDGNSRLSMLAMTHVLKFFHTGVREIPNSYNIRFLQLTKGNAKRNDDELVELLKEITLLNINKSDIREMLNFI